MFGWKSEGVRGIFNQITPGVRGIVTARLVVLRCKEFGGGGKEMGMQLHPEETAHQRQKFTPALPHNESFTA